MRNRGWFSQNTLGVFLSLLKIHKTFLSHSKSIRKLTQLSTTFMFTQKASSKQKWEKKMQEREIDDAVTLQLARRVGLLAVASCDRQLYGNRPVFTPETLISSTQILKLIENSTYDYSTA